MIAITREVSPSVWRCELSHLERTPIDYLRAVEQHHDYQRALVSLGFEVRDLLADADYPDSVFVEDTAIVLPELAIITRPGAVSRRGETRVMAEALAPLRPLVTIEEPGTIDGGDVLPLGRTIYIGRSARTNDDGINQVLFYVERHGYDVVPVEVRDALHLKTAVTRIAPDTLIINPHWVDGSAFPGWRLIECHPDEPFAANALLAGDGVIASAQYPRTLERIQAVAQRVIPVDSSELAKAEGGVTCCAVLVD
jgi:dimethylargininase